MALTAAVSQANAQVTVGVDPTQDWIGYMNVFDLPTAGGGYEFGSVWGTTDLQANFSPGILTLAPCVNVWETSDTYWVQADGVSPNKTMDASMYVQNDALAGDTVMFDGSALLNTLQAPYTDVAFIKDFTPNYGASTSVTAQLIPGQGFSLTLATTAGDHIQYGFETIGPDANPATVAGLGIVEIATVPEPTTLALIGLGSVAMLAARRRQ